MTLAYRIETETDDNGSILITCPSLPEVTTFAEHEDEVARHAREAVEEAIGARMAAGQDIPSEDRVEGRPWVASSALTGLKAALYMAMRLEKITRAELARRLGWHREQVDRLFRLDHASRLDQLQAAAQALGFLVEIELTRAA